MARGLRVSVTLSGLSRIFGDALAGVVEAARLAEEAGVDQIVLPDHLAIGPRTDRYPYGRFPLPPDEPWLEPLTALAVMAGATRRIRLGTGILIAPLRPALLLAKTVATLDVLSGGRVDLGVGIGWQREEFDAVGVPFEGRAARLDDTLRACRALWSGSPVSFRSASVRFEALRCLPRPVQAGGIPIWFGVAPTTANVARIVELGSGWMPLAAELGEVASGIRRLRQAFQDGGRDPESLDVRAHVPVALDNRGRADLGGTLRGVPELVRVGVSVAAFALGRFVRRAGELPAFFERIGALAR